MILDKEGHSNKLCILVLSHVIIGSEDKTNNEKFQEEDFGIEDNENNKKEGKGQFETKAHYAPSQLYYVLNKNQAAKQKSTANQRPSTNSWNPSMFIWFLFSLR